MNALAAVICIALVAANLALYQRHRARIAGAADDRPPYPMSWPTRLFRYFKGPLYAAPVVHVVWEALHGQPSPEGLVAGLALGLLSLLLLHWSLEALGVNFSPCDSGLTPVERVAAGPYRLLRHPIYASNLLLVGALGLIYFGPILVVGAALLVFFYIFSIYDEERVWRDQTR